MSKNFQQHEERTIARKQALQVMYQADILGKEATEPVESGHLVPETQGMDDYALGLLSGCKEHVGQLDELINAASENWTMDRMPVVDRSILRLATYEMRYAEDVPVSVSINEAVNLAKEFGGDDSPRFVNGILGRIANTLEGQQA